MIYNRNSVYPKKGRPPPMKEIAIPKKLKPLIEAFSADGESARALIIEAVRAICSTEDSYLETREASDEEVIEIVSLMANLAPQDAVEAIMAAQIITGHIMGMRMLSHSSRDDQNLGLRLLRFSNDALHQFIRKKGGGMSQQTINIVYQNVNQG